MVTVLDPARVVRVRLRPGSRRRRTRSAFALVKWAGATRRRRSRSPRSWCCSCSPAIRRGSAATMTRLEQVVPSRSPALIARDRREVRARARRHSRAAAGCWSRSLWSFPLWLSICRRHLGGRGRVSASPMPFTGSFLMRRAAGARRGRADAGRGRRISRGVPLSARRRSSARRTTPRSAPRSCCTLFSIGPSLLLGLFFAAQVGLNLSAACASWPIRPSTGRRRDEVSVLRPSRRQGRRLAREQGRRGHPAAARVPRVRRSASPATSGSTRSRTWS